jgi:transposase
MPKAYSDDLRARVAAAILNGRTCREAAALFEVSVSSAVKWSQRLRRTGTAASRPPGRKQPRSLAAEREWLLGRLAEEPDLPLRALVGELVARGVPTSYGSVWRIVHDEESRPRRQRGRARRIRRRGARKPAAPNSSRDDRKRGREDQPC